MAKPRCQYKHSQRGMKQLPQVAFIHAEDVVKGHEVIFGHLEWRKISVWDFGRNGQQRRGVTYQLAQGCLF